MSWTSLLEDKKFTIITGDGKEYTPKWEGAVKRINFNNSKYEYPDVEGTFVYRTEKTGDSYVLNIIFDGDNCIEIGSEFEESARDKNHWTLIHPFYGTVIIQPTDIDIDNTGLNVWRAVINATETLSSSRKKLDFNTVDEIKQAKEELKEASVQAITPSATVENPDFSEDINNLEVAYGKIIKTQQEFEKFKKEVGKTKGKLSNFASDVTGSLRLVNNIIDYPSLLEQSLAERFNTIKDQYNNLASKFTSKSSQADKEKFQFMAVNHISNLAYISIVQPPISEDNDGEYKLSDEFETRNDIYNKIIEINEAHSNYMLKIEELTSGGFIPDFESLRLLSLVVSVTNRNLENQIFGLKKEFTYILTEDTNAVLLTNELYELDKDDTNLDKFININNIGLNEVFNIRKGTKIKYYA